MGGERRIIYNRICPSVAVYYASLALATTLVIFDSGRNFQKSAQSLIHGFRIREGFGDIRLEKNEVRPRLVSLVVLPAHSAIQFRKVVFISHSICELPLAFVVLLSFTSGRLPGGDDSC